MMDVTKLIKDRTRWKVIAIALVVIVIGLLVLQLSSGQPLNWRTVLLNLGGFLVGTATVALLWELFAKRAFFEEILVAVRLSSNIRDAGITKFTLNYLDLEWRELFEDVREVDIFFSYGRSWRNNYVKQVQLFARRDDVKMRVLLPDRDNDDTVRQLAWRFEVTDEEIRGRIAEAIDYFQDKFTVGSEVKNRLEIRLTDKAPLYAFYRFDRTAVITFFNHLGRTGQVPSFSVKKGGELYEFALEEFETLLSNSKTLDGALEISTEDSSVKEIENGQEEQDKEN